MQVAVVVTVLNEEQDLPDLLHALARQHLPPAEIILVDGGSSDGTVALARSFMPQLPQLVILVEPGSNISAGRNRGISAARAAIVAVTDAGCTPEPQWLQELTQSFSEDQAPDLICGVSTTPRDNSLRACIGSASQAFPIRLGGHLLFPTARSLAFTRAIWERAGGFPQEMETGEDAAFLLTAVAAGAQLAVRRRARVLWQPRPHLGAVARQFYRYALGLAMAGLSRRFHRRTVTLAAVAWTLVLLAVLTGQLWLWALLVLLALAYLHRTHRQGCFDLPGWQRWYRVPLVLAVIHLATMAGVMAGNLRRWWRAG